MLKNYITVAFRTLWKSKSFSGLNMLGLSLGIACSLLILLWVVFFGLRKYKLYVFQRHAVDVNGAINSPG
jgi:hypothetical protein